VNVETEVHRPGGEEVYLDDVSIEVVLDNLMALSGDVPATVVLLRSEDSKLLIWSGRLVVHNGECV
jgi:hypothetical protein